MSKIQLQDFVYYGKLFSVYGKLLSEDRQKIMTDYFEFNMTLVEIAQERNISRQAVLDAVDKSCKKLEEFENVLHISAKKDSLEELLLANSDNPQYKEFISKVEQILKGN